MRRKHLLALFLFPAVFLTAGSNALAGQLARDSLITITTDIFPGESYFLGVVSDGNGTLTGISYQDPRSTDPDLHDKIFHAGALQTPQLLIKTKGYEVIRISLLGMRFSVHYKQDVREKGWITRSFDLDCDSKIIHCSAVDPLTKRIVTRAHLTGHRVYILGLFKTTVGIHEILTR